MINKIKFLWLILLVVLFSQALNAASISPRISLSEEYNDNIFLDVDENKISDWITVISPGVLLEARVRKAGVTIDYDFANSIYRTYSENDSYRHNASFDSWLKLSRYTELGLNNRFIQTEEALTDGDSPEIQNQRQLYYSNSVSADIDHTFGENRTINVSYTYDILENEDDSIEDNEGHNCSLSLNYRFIPHISLEADVSYEQGEYDISPGFIRLGSRTRLIKTMSSTFDIFIEYSHTDFNSDVEGDSGDYRIYNPSAGTNLTFGDGGTFSINAGYFVQDRDLAENERGLTLDGNLGQQWRFRHGLINITGSSGYEDSQLGSENLGFTIYYQAAVDAEYSFTRNVRTACGASWRYNDYVNPTSGQPDRDDNNYNMNASLSWQPRQWLNTNLAYRYQNRDSNIDENDYIENRITLSLSLVMDNR